MGKKIKYADTNDILNKSAVAYDDDFIDDLKSLSALAEENMAKKIKQINQHNREVRKNRQIKREKKRAEKLEGAALNALNFSRIVAEMMDPENC